MVRTLHLGLIAFFSLLMPSVLLAQMNEKGTVHLSIGLAGLGHATTYEQRILFMGTWLTDTKEDGAASVTFPLEAAYGFSRFFALGLYAEPGSYLDSSATESNGIVLVGLQPKFYLVNKDRFALMAGLQLGATTLRIERSETLVNSDARYAGTHFGITAGVGFGLGDLLSLNFQLRYLDTMLPLRSYELNGSNVDLSGLEATLSTRGLGAQLSLGFRF
jgi:hypothetical protein